MPVFFVFDKYYLSTNESGFAIIKLIVITLDTV